MKRLTGSQPRLEILEEEDALQLLRSRVEEAGGQSVFATKFG